MKDISDLSLFVSNQQRLKYISSICLSVAAASVLLPHKKRKANNGGDDARGDRMKSRRQTGYPSNYSLLSSTVRERYGMLEQDA